jgi:hypothetical protein
LTSSSPAAIASLGGSASKHPPLIKTRTSNGLAEGIFPDASVENYGGNTLNLRATLVGMGT